MPIFPLSCSVLSRVEMVTEDAPCCAVEGEINVILRTNHKLFLVVTLGLVQNGKKESGVRYELFCPGVFSAHYIPFNFI